MKLEFIQPRQELKPYVHKFWLFENNSGLVNHGTLIAPNARAKIIITYKNALTTTDQKKKAICKEGDIYFIGIRDMPVTLASPERSTGSIGIEFTTDGAYRFIKIPMHELTNNLFSFSELYGNKGKELLEKMASEENQKQKIKLIQEFLFRQLIYENKSNPTINYSVNFISSLYGLASIKELERKTGYSKRYLDILFKNHLGISPKKFATIERFQHLYKHFQNNNAIDSVTNIYESYYDQSHFIKEFKRYTGLTPSQYSGLNNDFGKHF